MARTITPSVVRQIESLFEGGSVAGLPDGQLIERFLNRRDAGGEAAFAALVTRHGPMVLGVCRQLLGDRHHAEDAFQATFFVLARKARSIHDPDLLGNWLYGVALRTARKARCRLARRRQSEADGSMRRPDVGSSVPADQPAVDREQAEALHDEIDRLPGTFRLPIVLCYFEGLTLDEAARQLRWPHGTVRSRLARARDKLRRGLTRRGVVLPAAALASVLDSRHAAASVSSPLCDITTRAAMNFAAGQAVSPSATALAQEVLRSMLLHKLRLIAMTSLFLGAVATGAGFIGHALAMKDEPRQVPADPRPQFAAKPDDVPQPPAPGRMTITGRVVDPQGRPVSNAAVMIRATLKQPGNVTRMEDMEASPIGQSRSDGSGRFQLDAPRTSSSTHFDIGAVAVAPGYGAGWADLNPAADRPAADITLRPEQVIHGRLFDLQDRPAAGVRVTVESMGQVTQVLGSRIRESVAGPRFHWGRSPDLPGWPRPAATDTDGRFTLHGIGRGLRVGLAVDDPRFALQRFDVDTDGPADSKQVTLALEPAKIITGRVTYADTGKPVPHALIRISSNGRDGAQFTEYETDGEGRYRVNPWSGDIYFVMAFSPGGQPYLSAMKRISWVKGAVEHSLDLTLPRGVTIHGKLTEEGSDKPVTGARVSFFGRVSTREPDPPAGVSHSGPDGAFQLAARPGPGHLFVTGPTDDYTLQAISRGMVYEGQPGGRAHYAHAIVACDPKPGGAGLEVNAVLRRGLTVKGRVVGPDGQPVQDTQMWSRILLKPTPTIWRLWGGYYHDTARDGRFELNGLDPDAETSVYFFEPRREFGATAHLSGESAAGGPVTVRLEPCGTAKARLVDPGGKPVEKYTNPFMFQMVIASGIFALHSQEKGDHLAPEQELLGRIDPAHYVNGPVSDAQGRIALPALIPGATYRLYDRTAIADAASPRIRKEFTVKPGETLDLGDILIEKPRP